jgi:hypothetical protein
MGRGLSELQKRILLYVNEQIYEQVYPYGDGHTLVSWLGGYWSNETIRPKILPETARHGYSIWTPSQRAAVSRAVRRLEQRGLIERHKRNLWSPNRQTYEICLTDNGRELLGIPKRRRRRR